MVFPQSIKPKRPKVLVLNKQFWFTLCCIYSGVLIEISKPRREISAVDKKPHVTMSGILKVALLQLQVSAYISIKFR